MSENITELPPQDAARTADLQPGAEFVDAEITMVHGEWNITLLTKKTIQIQSDAQEASGGATAPADKEVSVTCTPLKKKEVTVAFKGTLRIKEDQSREAQRRRWFKEMRGWLMVLATVAASASYQAGLNPPGGFWQDNNLPPANGSVLASILRNGTHLTALPIHGGTRQATMPVNGSTHYAGDPVLRDAHHSRYLLFFYFNATAFVTSLVIMVLLMSERFYHTEAKVVALMFTTIVDLASLIGAYTTGTTRYFSSCIYIIVITCVAFVGVVCIGEVMTVICYYVMLVFPCMETLVTQRWCPNLPGMENVKKMKAEREQHKEAQRKKKNNDAGTTSNTNTRTCCMCCA